MAKPNFQYEKRQKELEKKRKKEEKLKRKQDRGSTSVNEDPVRIGDVEQTAKGGSA